MNKTSIEWTDYTWNPVTGCLNNCPYCYARKIATRFKGTKAWPNGFEPMLHEDRINLWKNQGSVRLNSRIFVCSMGELFGDWVPEAWTGAVLGELWKVPDITFQFLTKCPWNLPKWNPWPKNAWVGVTATDADMALTAMNHLSFVDAPVRYLSLEPLLERMGPIFEPLPKGLEGFTPNQLIIGAQTNPYRPPRREWVEEIIEAADRAGIPVFLKQNLHWPIKREEFPK